MINVNNILTMEAPSLREAITLYFRNAITSGDLKPGRVIPSSRELAKQLNTSFPNVHLALAPLVKEGLITRDRKKGTMVKERMHQLACVAIYVYHTTLDDLPQYQHTLIDQLSKHLNEKNIESRLVVDNNMRYGLRQLREWSISGNIQGIITVQDGAEISMIVKELTPLPVSLVSCNEVGFDFSGMIKTSVQALKNSGCRKVAMITTVARFTKDSEGELHENKFYRTFVDAAEKAALECPADLIQMTNTESDYLHTSDEVTEFAFERCNRILMMPESERPDGLFVFPDQLITGLMLSIMQNRIRVPEDMRLVLHRNWEIKEPVLVPCAMVGISVSDMARRVICNLENKFYGKPKIKQKIEHELRMFVP
jgi:DNA-binding LacI/PurR family transcriptional regulator